MCWRWRRDFFTFYRTLKSLFIKLLQWCMTLSMILLTSLLIWLRYCLDLRLESWWRRYFFWYIFLNIWLLFLFFFSVNRRLIPHSTLRWRGNNSCWFNNLMFFLSFIKNWRSWNVFIFCRDIRIRRMLLLS